MTLAPLIPTGGYAGWQLLRNSLDAQIERAAQSPVNARDLAYFRSEIAGVSSAEQLTQDYRLLRVALGAFGLQDDLPNRAFITRVLGDGVDAPGALSNQLADKRYRAFSEAFGFGSPLPPRTQSIGFADRIITLFNRQSFEVAVGAQDPDLRLALGAERELPELAARGLQPDTAWLTVMGNPPLRKVFETAFGLPSAVGSLDLDQQLRAFRDGANRVLGRDDFDQFADPDAVETVIRSFTLRAEIAAGPSPFTPGMAALTLLQSAG